MFDEFKEETSVATVEEKPKRGRKPKEVEKKSEEVKIEETEVKGNIEKIKNINKLKGKSKLIKSIMKAAGVVELPDVKTLFKQKDSKFVKIKDIAVFISDNPNGVLSEIVNELPLRNTINLAAEVDEKRVKEVGIRILESKKIYMTIEVAKLTDGSKQMECWAGRHRLAFLALVYGSEIEIPVNIQEYTTTEARTAVLIANDARKTLFHEKAQNTFYKATGGDVSKEREDIYSRMATSKAKAIHYAIVSVMDMNMYGATLKFTVSETASRSNGSYTTVTNLQGFYNNAIQWSKKTTCKEMDNQIREATKFINSLVHELKSMEGFDPMQQLASQALRAIGTMFNKLNESVSEKNSPSDYAGIIAKSLIEMGQIGRSRNDEIYHDLVKRVKKQTNSK